MKSRVIPLAALCAVYAIFFFPFAYFRHDDWLILGNGALLPGNWAMLWHPTLFFRDGEQVWFFRPFFKLDSWLFFRLFGFHYALWLYGTLALTLGSLWLAASSLLKLGGDEHKALWFLTLFAAAVPIHFGSLVWIGEGLMNCPQVFGLMLSTWLFARGLLDRSRTAELLAILVFCLTLGFKESGVFHPAFLAALLFSEKKLARLPLRTRVAAFAPYALLGGVYLLVRLCLVPLNPAYLPTLSLATLTRPFLIISAALLIPLVIFARTHSLSTLTHKWPYLPFLALTVAPYLGHQFFSPGWLYYPGFFSLFILCLGEGELDAEPRKVLAVGLAVFAISLSPVLYRLNEMGWWQWQRGQRAMEKIVAELDPKSVTGLEIYSCENPKYPGTGFERVVGHNDALYFMWRLHHPTVLKPIVSSCSTLSRGLASSDPQTAILRWEFPNLTWIRRPPALPR